MKPSFVAPSQTLEKLLKEQIAATTNKQADGGQAAATGAKPKKRTSKKAAAAAAAASAASAPADQRSPPQPQKQQQPQQQHERGSRVDPTALSITDEEKEKRLQEEGAAAAVAVAAAEAGRSTADQPEDRRASLSQTAVDSLALEVARASLRPPENRPFFNAVYKLLDCTDNDYLALFALCLIYAMQQNAGKKERK